MFVVNTLILLVATCAAQPRLYMSATVGSSTVLPCDWRNKTSSQSSGETLHIEWRTLSKTVFERQGKESYQGEGYERRVDLTEDKLLSGDCSLLLKNITLSDAGPYESFMLEVRKQRSLRSKRVFLQSVELAVDDAPEPKVVAQSKEVLKLAESSNARATHPPLLTLQFIFLSNMFFYII